MLTSLSKPQILLYAYFAVGLRFDFCIWSAHSSFNVTTSDDSSCRYLCAAFSIPRMLLTCRIANGVRRIDMSTATSFQLPEFMVRYGASLG
jgi:hypothetical protein